MTSYHRNGVCGLGFEVATDGVSVGVRFDGQDLITVRQDELESLFRPKAKKLGGYRDAWAGLSGYVHSVEDRGAFAIIGYTDKRQRFVGIWLKDADEVPFAVFDLDQLPDVTFGKNSWRGDNHFTAVKRYLPGAV